MDVVKSSTNEVLQLILMSKKNHYETGLKVNAEKNPSFCVAEMHVHLSNI